MTKDYWFNYTHHEKKDWEDEEIDENEDFEGGINE